MHLSAAFNTIFVAAIAQLIVSCNSHSKQKVQVQEITLQEIKQEEKDVEPPPPPPPKDSFQPILEIKGGKTKCFVSEGLKYTTTVTLGFNDNEALGIVSSEELESGKKRTAAFTGARNGNEFTVSFTQGDPPLIGDASEWTHKPWTIKATGGKEILLIVFNAKNYDTNKWEATEYQFVRVVCK